MSFSVHSVSSILVFVNKKLISILFSEDEDFSILLEALKGKNNVNM